MQLKFSCVLVQSSVNMDVDVNSRESGLWSDKSSEIQPFITVMYCIPCFIHRDMQLWYQLRAEELEHMQAAYFGFKGRNNNNNKKLRNKSVFDDVTNMAYENQGFYR